MSFVRENKNNSPGTKTERKVYKRISLICRIFGHVCVYVCVCVCVYLFMFSAELMLIIIKIKQSRASLVAQLVKNLPAMWDIWVRSLGWEDPLEKGTTEDEMAGWHH